MSREERHKGGRERVSLFFFDLFFIPWFLLLFALPLCYLLPYRGQIVASFRPSQVVQTQPAQMELLLETPRVSLTLRLLEPQNARLQVLLSGRVVARFDGDEVTVLGGIGEVLEIDARTELRTVRVEIVHASGQYPTAGQQFVLEQEIRPLILR